MTLCDSTAFLEEKKKELLLYASVEFLVYKIDEEVDIDLSSLKHFHDG